MNKREFVLDSFVEEIPNDIIVIDGHKYMISYDILVKRVQIGSTTKSVLQETWEPKIATVVAGSIRTAKKLAKSYLIRSGKVVRCVRVIECLE